ncbi:hypothetical protein N7519_009157 [Penicillium mononematosum]|uniref:uncharacterized protein n=1 Tax=Penicillium mononematosum TaxID=268346 RepID=UPI002548B70B|nr:uncharacterized protein N7519_009157 [Penicillium mononematosum]KAJ6178696.1 hypothetical protein N7519_009157 [Penicillium mononematosum]
MWTTAGKVVILLFLPVTQILAGSVGPGDMVMCMDEKSHSKVTPDKLSCGAGNVPAYYDGPISKGNGAFALHFQSHPEDGDYNFAIDIRCPVVQTHSVTEALTTITTTASIAKSTITSTTTFTTISTATSTTATTTTLEVTVIPSPVTITKKDTYTTTSTSTLDVTVIPSPVTITKEDHQLWTTTLISTLTDCTQSPITPSPSPSPSSDTDNFCATGRAYCFNERERFTTRPDCDTNYRLEGCNCRGVWSGEIRRPRCNGVGRIKCAGCK